MSDAADDAARLRRMVSGYMVSQVIAVAAALGLADLMAQQAAGIDDLARDTGTHRPSLARLLRALVALGLAEEPEAGSFRMTPLGARLRTGVPGSMRNVALTHGSEPYWRAWGDLLHAVRTGDAAFEHAFGISSFAYLGEMPERAAAFDAYMADVTRQAIPAILAAHDFSRHRRIVDVGGGNGVLLGAILAAAPGAQGVVFDTPAGIAGARRRLEEAGVAQRCDIVAGDVFAAVPEGADAYLLKSILHDWDDARAAAILANCARAMRPGSVLLVVERLLPERIACRPDHADAAMMDLHMLVMPGGRERTAAEYAALLAAAGLRLLAVRPAPPLAVLEAARADAEGPSAGG